MKLRLVTATVAAMLLIAVDAFAATVSLPIEAIETQKADWLGVDNAFQTGFPLGDPENEGLSVRDTETHTTAGTDPRNGYLNGAMLLEVKGQLFADADEAVERASTGFETATSTGKIKGFVATVQYGFWNGNSPVGRAIYSFRNPKRVTRKITLRVGTSVAWGGSPEIVSEGTENEPLDASIDPSDSWFFVADGEEEFRAVIFGLGDATNAFDEVPDADSGTLVQTFSFKIKPKKTKSVMVFVQPGQDDAISGTLVTEAETYTDGDSVAASGLVDDLTAMQRARIVNWDLPPPAA